MPSLLSSVRVSSEIACAVSGGAAPAPVGAQVSDKTNTNISVGSTAGLVDKEYAAAVTVTTAGLTLDLTALEDALGNSISFSKVRAIKISNPSTTTGENLTIGGGTNGLFAVLPFTLDGAVAADAHIAINFGAGELTVDGTHKNLFLDMAAGSVSIVVTIIGR